MSHSLMCLLNLAWVWFSHHRWVEGRVGGWGLIPTTHSKAISTRRKLQRGLAPVCLVTSILHYTDIVRNTFYIHLTLSRPLLIYSHSLAYAAMGRVLSNRGHTYAVKSVLDVFSEHRAAQFGRNTKVCVRSKHESLAWCARDGFPIFRGYC